MTLIPRRFANPYNSEEEALQPKKWKEGTVSGDYTLESLLFRCEDDSLRERLVNEKNPYILQLLHSAIKRADDFLREEGWRDSPAHPEWYYVRLTDYEGQSEAYIVKVHGFSGNRDLLTEELEKCLRRDAQAIKESLNSEGRSLNSQISELLRQANIYFAEVKNSQMMYMRHPSEYESKEELKHPEDSVRALDIIPDMFTYLDWKRKDVETQMSQVEEALKKIEIHVPLSEFA